jgi:hypothetical protein
LAKAPDDLPFAEVLHSRAGSDTTMKGPGTARHRGVSSVLSVAVETGGS